MAVEVLKVQDGFRYGIAPDSSGEEFYLVRGATAKEAPTVPGVPKLNQEHDFAPTLIVRDVQVVDVVNSEPGGDMAVVLRAVYRPVNYSGLRTRFGAKVGEVTVPLEQPIFTRVDAGGGVVSYVQTGTKIYYRSVTQKIITSTSGALELDRVVAISDHNKGRLYGFNEFGQLWYILQGVEAWKDSQNVTYVRTVFRHSNPVPAIPVGFYTGQDVALPALGPLEEYVPSWATVDGVLTPFIGKTIAVPNQTGSEVGVGDPLPWL